MQESDKHGTRLDEQLKHETESLTHGAGVEARSQESRLQQDPDPLPNPADRPDIPDNPGIGIHQGAVEHRAALAMAIKPAGFPATTEALFEAASESFAPTEVMDSLRSLPAGRLFENVQEVWEALGGETEAPHT